MVQRGILVEFICRVYVLGVCSRSWAPPAHQSKINLGGLWSKDRHWQRLLCRCVLAERRLEGKMRFRERIV